MIQPAEHPVSPTGKCGSDHSFDNFFRKLSGVTCASVSKERKEKKSKAE